ncbi:CpaF family protein [Arcanobacterium phocisimile]|uniref:CpaF family protein n=1 Tax=Arcanobacterium phocisimile TaxID=1302235 RepID=A0ABX7IF84_9ACTO|nr:ATPase, T2SS/T4P/T4SS family [Arcanobacterium phocisimile]QRV01687.1 CpaF family protein [Arcanobacterium phocisimile]
MKITQPQKWLEERVRDLVRSSGLDPQIDSVGLEQLIDTALSEYEALTVTGQALALENSAEIVQGIRHNVGGFGPIQPLIDDPEIEEIWINEPGKVFVARGGRSELTTVMLNDQQVRDLVERMLRASGRRLDLSSPFVDAALHTGERLHVAIPDITRRHWSVNIRKYIVRPRRLTDLAQQGVLSTATARFLDAAVDSGLNIVVSGATQAGKTTFLGALLGAVPAGERIITAEEVFELNLSHRDVVAMQTRPSNLEERGEITLRRLVKEALRMRPERIVIGEVRQAEAFDMLIAFNSGIPGACTLHANSAREAVSKLCALPLLAGDNVTAGFVVPTVARSIDVIVHLHRDRLGRRRVREVMGVTGRVEGDVVETIPIFTDDGDGLRQRTTDVPARERFEQAGYDIAHLFGETSWDF